MDTLGLILAIAGVGALLYGAYRHLLVGQVRCSPLVKTGDAAASGNAVAGRYGEIAVEGTPRDGQTLVSPITQTECLYYEFEVKQSWTEKGYDQQQQEQTSRTRESVLAGEKKGIAFSIDDGSGPVRVDPSDGGAFDLEETFKGKKGAKLLQSFGEFKEGQSGSYTLGKFRIEGVQNAPDSAFSAFERILKPDQRLFVCGRLLANGAIGESGRGYLIISTRAREEFVAKTGRWTRELLYGGLVASVAGLFMYDWIWALVGIAVAGVLAIVFRMYGEQITGFHERLVKRVGG